MSKWVRRPVDGAPLHEIDLGDGVKATVVHAREWGDRQWVTTVSISLEARTMRDAKALAEGMAESVLAWRQNRAILKMLR